MSSSFEDIKFYSVKYYEFPTNEINFKINNKKHVYRSSDISYDNKTIFFNFYDQEPISGWRTLININTEEKKYLVKIETSNNFYYFEGNFNNENIKINYQNDIKE